MLKRVYWGTTSRPSRTHLVFTDEAGRIPRGSLTVCRKEIPIEDARVTKRRGVPCRACHEIFPNEAKRAQEGK